MHCFQLRFFSAGAFSAFGVGFIALAAVEKRKFFRFRWASVEAQAALRAFLGVASQAKRIHKVTKRV
jgi:hypothetical protein